MLKRQKQKGPFLCPWFDSGILSWVLAISCFLLPPRAGEASWLSLPPWGWNRLELDPVEAEKTGGDIRPPGFSVLEP